MHASHQTPALFSESTGENLSAWATPNKSVPHVHQFSSLEDIDLSADGSLILRVIISSVYAAVCAVGLVGNLLVFFLMKTKLGKRRRRKSATNFFVVNLAVTDFQFVLTLPFWAADAALDFSWPFGNAMCKIVLSVTVMNMYASVFFITAMSVSRYWSVACCVRGSGARRRFTSVKRVCAALWVLASLATAPTSAFSTVTVVAGERLCLLRFPDGHPWLALYHLQKVVLAFILPMITLSVCNALLLRFVRRRIVSTTTTTTSSSRPRRRFKVTKSVIVVVLSFFICWMPNHAITLWGVLVKFNVVRWDRTYYMVHTYVFPLTVCLAHANSCLNPVLYCLMRREFRKMLKSLFWGVSSPASTKARDSGGAVQRESV